MYLFKNGQSDKKIDVKQNQSFHSPADFERVCEHRNDIFTCVINSALNSDALVVT